MKPGLRYTLWGLCILFLLASGMWPIAILVAALVHGWREGGKNRETRSKQTRYTEDDLIAAAVVGGTVGYHWGKDD